MRVTWTTLTDGSSEMNTTTVQRRSRAALLTAVQTISRSRGSSIACNVVSGPDAIFSLLLSADGQLSFPVCGNYMVNGAVEAPDSDYNMACVGSSM